VFLVGNKAGQFSKIYCCTDYCESPFWELQHFRQTKHVDHYKESGDHCDKNNLQWPGENHFTGRVKIKISQMPPR